MPTATQRGHGPPHTHCRDRGSAGPGALICRRPSLAGGAIGPCRAPWSHAAAGSRARPLSGPKEGDAPHLPCISLSQPPPQGGRGAYRHPALHMSSCLAARSQLKVAWLICVLVYQVSSTSGPLTLAFRQGPRERVFCGSLFWEGLWMGSDMLILKTEHQGMRWGHKLRSPPRRTRDSVPSRTPASICENKEQEASPGMGRHPLSAKGPGLRQGALSPPCSQLVGQAVAHTLCHAPPWLPR